MNIVVKIGLSILLFACLLDMHYGYYQFVRFVALVGFAILAYQALQEGRQTEVVIYALLAILFQPIFKIALGRDLWNVVDVIVGAWLIVSVVIKPKSNK